MIVSVSVSVMDCNREKNRNCRTKEYLNFFSITAIFSLSLESGDILADLCDRAIKASRWM